MKIETTLREAAQQALKAYDQHYPLVVVMENLRAVLAKDALQRLTDVQQEIEAVLEQPDRKPLTDGELYTAYIAATNQTLRPQEKKLAFAFARAIEAAHGIGEKL